MRTSNNLIMNALAANANHNSSVIWAQDILRASFQMVATSSINGTVQLQASNDQAVGVAPNQFTPTNWFNIGNSVSITTSGVTAITETEMSYEYLRLVFTDASGGTSTGTITARMKAMAL